VPQALGFRGPKLISGSDGCCEIELSGWCCVLVLELRTESSETVENRDKHNDWSQDPTLLANNTLHVEMKCHLDATDGSLLQNLLFAQHTSGTIMPIVRSSRVLYRLLLLVVLWFSSCRSGVELWVCVSGLRDAARITS
jgi:hypothetical protein